MKLVELVKGISSSGEALEAAREFAESLGKTVIVSDDSPGFVVNRLLVPYLMEAVRAYEAGVASKEDIDEGARSGLGYPLGPFEVLDLVGLDVAYKMAERLYAQSGAGEGAEAGGAGEAGASGKSAEDVVDAEFEEVKDDKK